MGSGCRSVACTESKKDNLNAPAYSAAKAGRIGFTNSLREELAAVAPNVACNCVTPAAADTDLFKQMTVEHIAFMKSKIPMNRFVKVEEIAAMVTWLSRSDFSFAAGGMFDISGEVRRITKRSGKNKKAPTRGAVS